MNKKTLIISLCAAVTMSAVGQTAQTDTLTMPDITADNPMLKKIEPTYIENVTTSGTWSSNWFASVSGGAAAFAGSPNGDDDLFGRVNGAFSANVGKWFSPSIGTRLMFQTGKYIDCEGDKYNYQSYHLDLMWNVNGYLYKYHEYPKWTTAPYAGVGFIHTCNGHRKPFAFSYGVTVQYRVHPRIHIGIDLGGTTTFKDFDGYGSSNKIGDNIFCLSAGLTINIGKLGWRRVVDAKPYMEQNRWLLRYVDCLENKYKKTEKKYYDEAAINEEMRKILDIEGLLEKYNSGIMPGYDDEDGPYNNYSGINSLRNRMGKGNKIRGHVKPSPDELKEYRDSLGTLICSPVYFFFKIGTVELTDDSQLLNLEELARVAKKYDMRLSVTGAADSMTGTDDVNNYLSSARADFICHKLTTSGIAPEDITSNSVGGINDYSPAAANRNAKVCLSFKE